MVILKRLQTIRRALWMTTALLVVVSGWVIARAWQDLKIQAAAGSQGSVSSPHDSQANITVDRFVGEDGHSLKNELTESLGRPLQRPLFDPPPPVTVAPPPPPRLRVRLLGTALEAERAQAIVALASGETRFVGVGDDIDGSRIVSINDNAIVIHHQGSDVTLTVEGT